MLGQFYTFFFYKDKLSKNETRLKLGEKKSKLRDWGWGSAKIKQSCMDVRLGSAKAKN